VFHCKILTWEALNKHCNFLDSLSEGAALFITTEGGHEQNKAKQHERHSSALYLVLNTQYKTIFFQKKAEGVRDTSSTSTPLIFPFIYVFLI